MMFCPHCLRASFSKICSYCGGEHEPMASRIRRRQGWKKLLVRPAIAAAVLSALFLLLGVPWPGWLAGALLGAIVGAAFQSLVRVRRFR